MTAKPQIVPATPRDVPFILQCIHDLAEYERLSHEVVATEGRLHEHLFGSRPYVEALIGRVEDVPAGFALFHHNYSTFLAQPGLYLEDVYVRPEFRGGGLGRALLVAVAAIAVERGCGRYEWSVLDWNAPAIGFYENLGAEMSGDWRRMRVAGPALEQLARGVNP
jgi:GNAT superfamily N-acetyltransferase